MKLTRGRLAAVIIVSVLLIDQLSKLWIKTHMELHQSYEIASWFKIYFIENNGMAFGMEVISKLFLSLFRIVAVCVGGYYLFKISKSESYQKGYIACIALVLAGAFGNIIDSLFYGIIFNHSVGQIATLFPEMGGYGTLFHGKVVDMLYFPLFSFNWPEWIPFVGGDNFQFFRPVFNIADSAITVGVIFILLFYRKYLSSESSPSENSSNK